MSSNGPSHATSQNTGQARSASAPARESPEPARGTDLPPGAADILALQRAAGNRAVDNMLRGASGPAIPGGGRPLDRETREEMETRFGHDFGRVRVHDGPRAAESAAAVGARAYTIGQDIVFDAGGCVPTSGAGKRLLAHELAHVVQQGRGGGPPSLDPGGSIEQAADAAARRLESDDGLVAVDGASGVGIARQAKSTFDDESAERLRAKAMAEFLTGRPAGEGQERWMLDWTDRNPPKGGLAARAPAVDTVGLIAEQGVSMEDSVRKTHWNSDRELRDFMRRYIAYAKDKPRLQKQHQDAVAARERILAERAQAAATREEARKEERERRANKQRFDEELRKANEVPLLGSLLPSHFGPYVRTNPQAITNPLLRQAAETNRRGTLAGATLTRNVGAVAMAAVGAGYITLAGGMVLAGAVEVGTTAVVGSRTAAPIVSFAISNPIATEKIAEFAVGSVITIATVGVKNYLKHLGTPEGMLQLLYATLDIACHVTPPSGGPPTRGTGQGQIVGVSDEGLTARITRPIAPQTGEEALAGPPAPGAPGRSAKGGLRVIEGEGRSTTGPRGNLRLVKPGAGAAPRPEARPEAQPAAQPLQMTGTGDTLADVAAQAPGPIKKVGDEAAVASAAKGPPGGDWTRPGHGAGRPATRATTPPAPRNRPRPDFERGARKPTAREVIEGPREASEDIEELGKVSESGEKVTTRGKGPKRLTSRQAMAEAGKEMEAGKVREFAKRNPGARVLPNQNFPGWLRKLFPKYSPAVMAGPDAVAINPARKTIKVFDSTGSPTEGHLTKSANYVETIRANLPEQYKGYAVEWEESYWQAGEKGRSGK